MKRKLLIISVIGIVMFLICAVKSDVIAASYSNQKSSVSRSYKSGESSIKKSYEEDDDDDDDDMDTKLNVTALIMKSAFIGLLVATAICVFIWLKHKPVKVAKNATHYLNQNSVNITNSYDHFSTSTVDKTPINRK